MTNNISILYVEDDPITNLMISKLLKPKCSTLISEHNGLDGFNRFKSETPDLVITDLAMPQMDGFQLIREIRKLSPDIPIVITSAYREEIDQIENVTIIDKPVIRDVFLKTIDAMILDLNKS